MPDPPRAERRPTVLRHGDDERVDEWYWLRERDDPAVLAYLERENEYTKAALAHTDARRETLFHEIKARVQETDVSAPVHKPPYDYFTRTFEGRQYELHGRRPTGADDGVDEEVLVDENALADGHEYFALGGFAVSPDQALLAYSTDVTGGERYELRVRDLAAGRDLPETIRDTSYGLAWANDNSTLFYVRPDDAERPFQVWRHTLGTTVGDDVLVYEEDDEMFHASIGRTRSGRFVMISVDSKTTSETRCIDADDPTSEPFVVEPRRPGVEYHVEHHRSPELGERFYVLTNDDGADNFKLMVTPVSSPGRAQWREVLAHRPEVRLDDVDAFAHHLVVTERADALERMVVTRFTDDDTHVIAMPEPVYSVHAGSNPDYDTTVLRYQYTSMVVPGSSYDYDMDAKTATLVKRQPVLGYDPERYETHREWATAPDGTRVPISLVHRRGLAHDGSAPCLLYGYGSYEISIDPTFSSARLSLLERDFVFAIAHVRGGGELGRHWYDDGKLAHKRNTFTDFIACAEHLIALRYTSPRRLAARGGSAGGLLMGAIANLRPDLFRAIVAEVPFVDCLTTILDEALPLTITEWEEWGNPVTDPAIYALMKSYSPYDNVAEQRYPAMLVTGGLNDPRVRYWEPAKWVAKLRTRKIDDRLLVLKTELGAGHSGPSGRYDAWRDEAFVLAFVLDQLGVDEPDERPKAR
ncbi:MAG TPA: S9 family peptidase [Acidimicrobiia bacterium]|nr:S9 family peptidase [Acidimicrobiia bacterium]